MIKVVVTSIMVDDQNKALKFYTEKLGFVVKHDVPASGEHRWLTVVAPNDQNGVEILLEPLGFAPARD
ncbi:MAG TPA: VOC family protein, partial [Candidatus Kapabacteria bacterium]|nr:VOC family protein [Candidatus Kapabacteria bacterium]